MKAPKKIKRLIREYAAEAYERELHQELQELDRSFAEWREGTIGSGELSHRIHQYETGPSRELFKRYNYGYDEINVAQAVVLGILDRNELPPELSEFLEERIKFYESLA